MSNYSVLKKSKNGTLGFTFLLLFCFTGIASATLSGISPGYPRFISDNTQVDYYQDMGNTFFLDAYNTSSKVFWQEGESMSKQRVRGNPFFYTQVDIDATDPNNPQVLEGSFLQVWGFLPGQLTNNRLLFSANISGLFWDTNQKIIEFILEGDSHAGAVCDLGFCSFHDEVLHFTLEKFNGDWSKAFSSSATAVATVPLPAAAWLFGCAVFGLFGFQRRKDKSLHA